MPDNQTGKTYKYWTDRIPERFRKDRKQRCARNVGMLKAMLAELPDDLPIRSGFGVAGVCVVAFNVIEDFLDPHLQFEDGDYDGVYCDNCNDEIEDEAEDGVIQADGRLFCHRC